jgi:hypothetical protein
MAIVLKALFAAYLLGLAGFCVAEHKVLFAWPAGIVTGNLLASCIWAPLAVIHLDQLARRHHREHVATEHRHHIELKEHVGKVMTGGE